MKHRKTIHVDEGTKNRLSVLKYKLEEKTLGSTIEYLIAYYEYTEAKGK